MIKRIISKLYFSIRFIAISSKSNNKNIEGGYKGFIPVVIRGKGRISFGEKVNIGVINAPLFYNSYAYLEPRNKDAIITFGNNVNINNAFSVVSEKSITIGDDVLIGYNCNISDSNFHDLSVNKRKNTDPNPQEVIISKNVFIGNNVTILKGVILGENVVVAANSVVTKTFPKNSVIGGNPAIVIRSI